MSAPVLIWMAGTDKLCTFFNKPWLDFTGRSTEQELGTGWAEGVHPDDPERCLQVYTSAFDARQPFVMQYRLRRDDGEYRWISDQGVPRYDAQGTFAGYIGWCVDVTELMTKDEALRQSEERMRLAAAAVNLGIWEWHLATNEIWATNARRAVLGWPDRKSTRLNSSHVASSYAVFCLKKKRSPPHPRQAGGARRGFPAATRGAQRTTIGGPASRGLLPAGRRSILLFFFFAGERAPRDLHSFPTRRSSDLMRLAAAAVNLGIWEWHLATNEIWATNARRAVLGW